MKLTENTQSPLHVPGRYPEAVKEVTGDHDKVRVTGIGLLDQALQSDKPLLFQDLLDLVGIAPEAQANVVIGREKYFEAHRWHPRELFSLAARSKRRLRGWATLVTG
jgi:hypothetical protein